MSNNYLRKILKIVNRSIFMFERLMTPVFIILLGASIYLVYINGHASGELKGIVETNIMWKKSIRESYK